MPVSSLGKRCGALAVQFRLRKKPQGRGPSPLRFRSSKMAISPRNLITFRRERIKAYRRHHPERGMNSLLPNPSIKTRRMVPLPRICATML